MSIKKKKNLINWCGLLGIVSLISITMAIVFAPSAYPGYDWKSQAVSALSAVGAPSALLWSQLASLYGGAIISIMMVCVSIQGRLNKILRLGIYFYAAMQWVVDIGYAMFPLSGSDDMNTFIDIIHNLVVTPLVVLFSVASLILIMIGGYRKRQFISIAVWATIAFTIMMVGAIGMSTAPAAYFGIFQRLNHFATTSFNAVLGAYLFLGLFERKESV